MYHCIYNHIYIYIYIYIHACARHRAFLRDRARARGGDCSVQKHSLIYHIISYHIASYDII